MTIYYYLPDSNKPSWGVGIIYHHVHLLVKYHFQAYILHDSKDFRIRWLDLDVPVRSLEEFPLKNLRVEDILVVPEVCMNLKGLKSVKCRKVLFLQAPGYIYESLPLSETHTSLGFADIIYIMPHQEEIIKKFIHLPAHLVPPFIPENFFCDEPKNARKMRIVLYPKMYQVDYTIVKKILHDHLLTKRKKVHGVWKKSEWELIELKDLQHDKVASILKTSTFFISLNLFEALNTSVVEAMAGGCIVFTYEAYGPRDYLSDRENAFVFGNNEAYALVEKLIECIDEFEEKQQVFEKMRQQGIETARSFNLEKMEEALINTFTRFAEASDSP